MAWVLGTPLVPNLLALKRHLGPMDLSRLETDTEKLDELLEEASDALYRHVSKRLDPSKLSNSGDYKSAVATHVLAVLVRAGHLSPPTGQVAPVNPLDWSGPMADAVEPQLSEGLAPPSTGMARPKVVNVNASYFG